jgi:hypothetical protein
MIVWRYSRAFLSLTLAMVAVWATMVTVAEASGTPSMHCHGTPMPCCPPTDAGAAHCAAAQCCVEMPQRAEAPSLPVAQATGAVRIVAPQQFPVSTHAMVRGAAWQPDVFRLKDDLRI